MKNIPTVSIIITTYNRKRQLLRSLNSILSSRYPLSKLQIIVVDDASTDGTLEAVESLKRQTNLDEATIMFLRNSEERYVSACQNLGLKVARGEYVFFVHDDEILDSEAIRYLIEFLERNKDVGLSGPIVYYSNIPYKIWCAGVKIYRILSTAKRVRSKKADYILCDATLYPFMTRKELALKVGFNSKFFPMCSEDVDFCLNVSKMGYKIVVLSRAKAWHDRPEVDIRSWLYEQFKVRCKFAYSKSRSSLLMCKVLNKNIFQFIVSLIFTLLFLTTYVITNMLLIHNLQITKNLIKGIADGFILISRAQV